MSISLMRSPIRTAIVLAVAAALVVLFLRNVDLRHVGGEIIHARMRWLTISFATAILSLIIRSLRWQYLLEPLAGVIGRVAEKFSRGLGAVRRPGRLAVALLWSFPLWLTIAAGLWAVSLAFRINVPFTGSFLLVALLVIGVAVPTPGAVGGFHEAYRLGAAMFFGPPDSAAVGAAVVAHLFSLGP